MATWNKCVRRSAGVHINCRFTAEPEGHVGADGPAQGTFTAGGGALAVSMVHLPLSSLAPIVASVDVATCEVDPRLTFFKAEMIHQDQN